MQQQYAGCNCSSTFHRQDAVAASTLVHRSDTCRIGSSGVTLFCFLAASLRNWAWAGGRSAVSFTAEAPTSQVQHVYDACPHVPSVLLAMVTRCCALDDVEIWYWWSSWPRRGQPPTDLDSQIGFDHEPNVSFQYLSEFTDACVLWLCDTLACPVLSRRKAEVSGVEGHRLALVFTCTMPLFMMAECSAAIMLLK